MSDDAAALAGAGGGGDGDDDDVAAAAAAADLIGLYDESDVSESGSVHLHGDIYWQTDEIDRDNCDRVRVTSCTLFGDEGDRT